MQNQMPAGNVAESELIARTLTVTTTEKTVSHSEQDQELIRDIATAQAQLTAVLADAEVLALLGGHGYTEAKITAGLEQVNLAETMVRARQRAIAIRATASEEFVTANDQARREYSAFRLLARAIFTRPADRTEMGLRYGVPTDLKLFLPRARLGYTAALENLEYAQQLQEHSRASFSDAVCRAWRNLR